MTAPLPSLQELLHWPEGQAPYAKQEEGHQKFADAQLAAIFSEQRCGKTPMMLGTAVYQYRKFLEAGGFGKEQREYTPHPTDPKKVKRPHAWANEGIDAVLVVALPSGVPPNWGDETDKRMPKSVNPLHLVWRSSKAGTKTFQNSLEALLHHRGLSMLFINGEAIPSAAAKIAIGKFLRARRALVIGDETTLICSEPGNVRSKVMKAISKLPGAVMRRIMDGTPSSEGPLKLYSQVGFLSPAILGFDSYIAFKNHYARWEKRTNHTQGRDYPVLIEYANLDELRDRLKPYAFRVKRTDCFDIPNKIYTPYKFQLSPAQRKVYDPLRDEFEAELQDGSILTANHVLARMTRLDQVTSNFVPPITIPTICNACGGDGCEACGDVGAIMGKTARKTIDPDRNPRIDALQDVLEMNAEPGIIWARYDETINAALALGEKLGRNPVRYDGKVDHDAKRANLKAFQGGSAGLIVAKERSMGRGVDGSAAKWMCYVENGYSFVQREQSEDRAEVGGRTFGTGIIDLIAEDTEDEKKMEAHRLKMSVADLVMGENRKHLRFAL